jgi:hypothetical protein
MPSLRIFRKSVVLWIPNSWAAMSRSAKAIMERFAGSFSMVLTYYPGTTMTQDDSRSIQNELFQRSSVIEKVERTKIKRLSDCERFPPVRHLFRA